MPLRMIRVQPRQVFLLLVLGAMTVFTALGHADEDGNLVPDKESHDFGVVGQNEELEAVFTFTNRGTATITGIRAQPDCGCYGLALSDTVLGAGEKATLRIKFRTLNFFGPLTKHARISYDDGKARTLKLGLTMRVEAGVLLSPSRIYFGELVVGKLAQQSVQLLYREGRGTPFRVTRVDAPDGEFAPVKPIPFTDPRDAKWKGWALVFRFVKAPPKGVYSKRAWIHTDHPEYPKIELSLTGNIVGKVWVQRPIQYAGLVPAGEKRVLTTLLRPARGSGVKLGTVRAVARKGVWQVAVAPVPGRPEHYLLTATLPATAPAGRVDDVIEIRTDVPGEPVTTIRVKGRVYVKRG